jgi:hypothetical protein
MSAGKVFGVWSLGIFTFSFLANVNTTPELAQFGLGSIAIIALAGGTLGFAVLPFVFYLFRKPSWPTEPVAPEPAGERIGEPEPEPV